MTAAAAVDGGDGPEPPADFDSPGLAVIESDDAPPPLDVDEVEAEVEVAPKKKTRTTRSRRKKT
jgi:hypothetical protein